MQQHDIQQNDINEIDNIESMPSRRLRLPPSHPVLATIEVEVANWHRFENLVADTPTTKIIAHDDPHDGWITVHVGCIDHEVQDRLEKGWR